MNDKDPMKVMAVTLIMIFLIAATWSPITRGHDIHPGLQWSCLQPWVGFAFSTPMSHENFVYLSKEAEELCSCVNTELTDRYEIEQMNEMDTALQNAITKQIMDNLCTAESQHIKDTMKRITDDVKRQSQGFQEESLH